MIVVLDIARMAALWLALWIASGVWIAVFLLPRLVSREIRWPLTAVGGMATHMILVLNLSYLGISVRKGWFIALGIALVPVLWRWRHTIGFLKTARGSLIVVAAVTLGVAAQTWPLIKEGIITTAPAENGDWLTYVSHSDILADYGYGYSAAATEYPQHFIATDLYETANFRYGPSHLLASSSVVADMRAIHNFNVFCGCLIGLVACSVFAFAYMLRLGRTPAISLGLLWAVHPSVHWVGLAAFMPQLVGTSMMISLMAICPLLWSRKSKLALGVLLGVFLCGLFVAYNELIPLTGAAMGLSLVAVARLRASRWKNILMGAGIMSLCTILFSPIGIYRGFLGMLLQVELARRTGGPEQAVGRIDYLFGSWLGMLPLPPTAEMISHFERHPWYSALQAIVLISLGVAASLLFYGLRRCGRAGRVMLPITLAIAVFLGAYIQFSFDIPQFRTWGLFKLTQYILPIAGLSIALGVSRAPSRFRGAVNFTAGCLIITILGQGLHFLNGFPRTSLRVNSPRYGTHPTVTDIDFVEAVNRIVPPGVAVLSVSDVARVRYITPLVMLYPRKVLVPETPISSVLDQGIRYAVEDKNYPRVRELAGVVKWENERYSIIELFPDQVYLSLADPPARLLGPASEILLPTCTPGDSVAIHGFAVDGGSANLQIGDSVPPTIETIDLAPGEFISDIPLRCGQKGAKTIVRTSARVFVADFELIKNAERRKRLAAAATELSTDGGILMNTLPPLIQGGAWQVRKFDGSPIAPEDQWDKQGLRLSSRMPLSGGLETVISVGSGWYDLEASGNITKEFKGNGRGFGLGFLRLPESQLWLTGTGPFTVKKLIHVPEHGPRVFSIILGGYGTLAGEVHLTRLELKPVAVGRSLNTSSTISIPPLQDPAWSPVAYDGSKEFCERNLTGDRLTLESSQLTSSGLGLAVDLGPGTYALSSRIEATAPATGPGLGYAVLIEGLPASIVNLKEAGRMIGERVFTIAKAGRYRLVTMIGGYGLSKGEASFSDIKLRRLNDRVAPVGGGPIGGVQLPDLDSGGWRVVTLDPSPGTAEIQRGIDWISIGSAGQISGAAAASLRLDKGAYMLGADIVAKESALGSGKGYGVGLLQRHNYQWYFREAGSHRITSLIIADKGMEDTLALIVGGFGTVKGSARFSRPVIRPLRFSSLSAIK